MKTIQQVIGYIEGWKHAIATGDQEEDNSNIVFSALSNILEYIGPDTTPNTITTWYPGDGGIVKDIIY